METRNLPRSQGSASRPPRAARKTRALRLSNEARCRGILEKSALVEVDDLDWSNVGAHQLDSGVIDTLVYMRDVEGFTDTYAVGLAAHKTTLADPLIRDFLRVWQAEEIAHSQALARFLDAYASATGITIPAVQPTPTPAVPRRERLLAHVGGPVGKLVAAAHMTWGAANELLTMNGYRLLAARAGNPVLRELLTRIAAQEARHYSFYVLQAEWRLARSPLARAVLPRLLRRAWTPVGVGDGYKRPSEFRRVLGYLSGGDAGARAVRIMDASISALPGFDGLRIYARVAA